MEHLSGDSNEDSLYNLAQEARELYLDNSVPVLDFPPSPLVFFRDYVSRNKPVVIRNAFNHWLAVKNWSTDYLRKHVGTIEITVAVTPDGYADAVRADRFVIPEERRMTFNEFLDILNAKPTVKSKSSGIFYIQKQNSNFHTEFHSLAEDVDEDFGWATEAFGKKPDAVNFWMGDCRAVTSIHKDHYENLYCVVSGEKLFTLLPPTDQPFVPYEYFQAAVYKENTQKQFDIIDDLTIGQVPWIPIDVLNPDFVRYPLYKHARPVSVTVQAGDLLYLPSLWYHHVQQSHGCIAVNYWYDMDFDIKYCYYKFVESLVKQRRQLSL